MTSFTNPHFAEPQWLWLAIASPVLLAVLHRYAARERRRQLATLASAQFLDELTRSHSRLRRAIKNALLVLAVAGTGIALARPQWGVQELSGQSLGEDIVFALDCSRSMLAADVSPNRLERAKLAVQDFVRRHNRGRVGLVAFAGQAFLQCPLTFDYGAFEDALRALDEKTIPIGGTDLGRALDEAFRAMERADRRKVVVLLTDGEDLEKAGVRTAESLAEQGIVVFAVGVGTETGSEIRVLNEQGQADFVRDRSGEVVRSRLDETALRKIAEATKGNYFPLGQLGEGLTKIRLVVSSANFTSGPAPVRRLGVDRFYVVIAIALGLLVMESLLGTRRRGHA
jgi:Ca-activated chloride channel family protein